MQANEFKKISSTEETRYVLESGSSGGTSAGSIASVEMPVGGIQKRTGQIVTQEGDKVKNPVAKAAQKVAKGSGKHKNPKDAVTQPRKEKHKKDSYSESLEQALESKVAEATGDDKFDTMMGRISQDPWTRLNSDPNWEYEIEELVDRHIEPWLLAIEKSDMPITKDEETLNPGWRKRYEQVANKLAQEFLTSRGLNPRDPDLVGKIRYAIDSHTDQSRNVAGQLSAYSELPMQRYADAFDADGQTANMRDAMVGFIPTDDDDDDDSLPTRPRPDADPRRLDPGNVEEGLAESGFDINRPDPVWITINGKRWKWFFNYVVGRKAMDTLNAKFRKEGSNKRADWEPADLEDDPAYGIKVGESALDKFRQGAAEREKKHADTEKEMNARHARGEEDMKGSIDRLEKQVNAKESNEYNEYSDEVGMVENNLHTIVRCCKELAKALKPGENLPEWIEEKISMSKQNVVTALDYMLSQHEQGHVYDEDHSTATGGWGQGSMNAAYKSSALAGAGHDDRTMESDDYFNKLKETLEAAVDERSKSQAQWNLMHAVANNPAFAKKVGVKQSVGKEFSAADAGHNPRSLPKRVVPKKKK